jgi:hypothetical protein
LLILAGGLASNAFGVHLFLLDLMKRTREQVAGTIEALIDGTGRQWDWDGFISIRLDDPELEAIRQRCVSLPVEFPPSTRTEYCNEAGLQVMRDLVQGLRSQSQGTPAA